jgi:RNA polymerase sigma factor (sigma-70 family)
VATVPADIEGPGDAELIASVRSGQVDAYGSLYARHVTAAYNLARQLSRSSAEADDLVSEAFAKVLDTLRGGGGPDESFRAYLLTSLRHVAYDKTRRDRRLELTEDVETSGAAPEKISEPFRDTAVAGLERSLAAQAFARLPERWRAVLWHTEIEGQSPAQVAPLLGLTANGVSALAYRAREGLRQAYLQVYLTQPDAQTERCQATVDKLGAWTRSGLSRRETAQVETHLDECDRCRALAAELADVNGALRVYIAPLVLGGAAAAYLAAAKTTVVGVAAVSSAATAGVAAKTAVAAGAAAKGGGAAGAASSLPRQLLGVGGPVAALAAALALALTASTGQQVPAAQAPPPPPPAHSTPAAPVPAPPAAPSPAPAPPPVVPPAHPAAAPINPPPPPAQPALVASGPAATVELTPGGPAANVPITVTNSGGSPSGPVSATLNLPPGVSALGPGQHMSAAPMMLLDAAGTGAAGQVDCPGGTGTVTCTSSTGLAPGQSVVLMFRLVAANNASGGVVTGSVSSGTVIPVRIAVPVRVTAQPAAMAVDAMRLTAVQSNLVPLPWLWWLWPWSRFPALDITATNTGGTTQPITVTVNRPADLMSSDPIANCAEGATEECQTTVAVQPGGSFDLQVMLKQEPWHDQVTVTATLGSVRQSTTVNINCPPWPAVWPSPLPPPSGITPTTDPTTTTPTTDPTTSAPTSSTGPTSTTTSGPDSSPTSTTTTVTPPPLVSITPTGDTTVPGGWPPPAQPSGTPSSPICPTGYGGYGRVRPGTVCDPMVWPN